jgi:ABC-2 type transport system permease protein
MDYHRGVFFCFRIIFIFFENDFNILDIGTASLQSFFTLSPWLFLFIIPALAMKSFAEEQQNGTLQWLFLNL